MQTREDLESGGSLLLAENGSAKLHIWTTSVNEDLYAPSKRGRAYRYSHLRVAQRVLLASGERLGLLTNGVELIVLISDPARPDSIIGISLDPGWKRSRDVPDSFRLLLALASPAGLAALPEIVDKARLQQARGHQGTGAQPGKPSSSSCKRFSITRPIRSGSRPNRTARPSPGRCGVRAWSLSIGFCSS